MAACLALVLLGVVGTPNAKADPGDLSNAWSRFLGGTLLLGEVPLEDIASLDGAAATNGGTPEPVTDAQGLDLTVLQALSVSVPGGLSMGLLSDFLQLGAVNQFAQALDNGVSRAAAGAVADDGAVDTTGTGDFPASATVTLSPLLALAPFAGVLDQFGLSFQGITGVAALDAANTDPLAVTCTDLSAPVHCRDYSIAGGRLALRSPTVAGMTEVLSGPGGVAETVDAAVATLAGSDGLLADALATLDDALVSLVGDDALTVEIVSGVGPALDAFLDTPLEDGVVSINLRTGAITADIDGLVVSTLGSNLDDLPPNTEILSSLVLGDLGDRVLALLAQVPALVDQTLTTALESAELTIAGTVCVVGDLPDCTTAFPDIGTGIVVSVDGSLGQVLDGDAPASVTLKVAGLPVVVPTDSLLSTLAAPILTTLLGDGGVLDTVVPTVATSVGGIVDAVVPVLDALNGIASLVANVQEPGLIAGQFREIALRLTVGDVLGAGGVGTIELGRAEVGVNALGAGYPDTLSLSPDRGPLSGGTEVTITGSNFILGVSTVVFDGAAITPSAVAADGTSLTFVVPPGTVAGPVDVTVNNGPDLDSSPPLTYTYLAPVLGASSPVVAGNQTTATGGGWPPNTSVTLQLHDSTAASVGSPVTVTTTSSGELPAGTEVNVPLATPSGTLTLVATDSFGNTASAEVDVIGAPTGTSLSPDRGPLSGGTEVTVTGASFVDGVTTVIFDGEAVTPTSVSSDGTTLTFDTPPGTVAGPVDVVVSNGPGLDSEPLVFTFAPPTVAGSTPTYAGDDVEVTGAGWPAGAEVTLQLDDGDGNPIGDPVTVTTTADGELPDGTVVPVPLDTPTLSLTLVASDEFGNEATDDLDVIGAPVLVAMDPDNGPLIGGTEVTVTGSGFVDGDTVVVFDGTSIVPDAIDDDGLTLTFTVPPATVAGPVEVVISNGPGLDSDPLDFTYAAPAIAGSSPVFAGDATAVTGAGWPAGAAVTLQFVDGDGSPIGGPVTVTTTSGGELPAGTDVPVPLDTPTQTLTLTAIDEFGNTAEAEVDVIGAPVPVSLDPDSGPLVGGTEVTITGSGFVDGATEVVFDGQTVTPDSVDEDGTSLTFMVPPGTVAGPVEVVVSNGPGLDSDPLAYTYAAPTVAGTTPVIAGEATTATGSGWPANALVILQFEDAEGDPVGLPVTVTTTGTGELPAGTTVTVPVDTPSGSLTLAATDQFDNTAEAEIDVIGEPAAESLDPDNGPLRGGNIVTVDGADFVDGVTEVVFDGETITPDAVSSDGTSLTFTVPPGTVAGPVEVVISNGPDLESEPLDYTFADPTLAATSPVAPGTSTTATGTGWPISAEVMLQLEDGDGDPVGDPLTVTTTATGELPSGTAITVPGGTAEQVLTLVATDEFDNTADAEVEVIGTPTATAMSPDHGPLIGGTEVTVTGTDFAAGATTVVFDGDSVTPTSVSDDGTSLVFTVPPGTLAGPVDVVISNGPELDSAPMPYTYDEPAIAASSPVEAGTSSALSGTGWPASTSVAVQLVDGAGDPVGDPATFTTTQSGEVPVEAALLVAADAAAGTYSVVATDAFGNVATTDLEVEAASAGGAGGDSGGEAGSGGSGGAAGAGDSGSGAGADADADGGSGRGGLARTGADHVALLVAMGLLLVVAGSALLGLRRRVRPASRRS